LLVSESALEELVARATSNATGSDSVDKEAA
jgi:hypothetical protein